MSVLVVVFGGRFLEFDPTTPIPTPSTASITTVQTVVTIVVVGAASYNP
jgi:hypothetical protein